MMTRRTRYRCTPLRWLAVLAISILLMPAAANSDVIWLADQKDPVFGLIDDAKSTPEQIVFSKTENGTDFEVVTFERDAVKAIVVNVVTSKLESLTPDKPNDWFDLAETLSTQKQDPVARKLAIRLYLVAAKHANAAALRDAAIQNLIPLARSEQEAQRFARFSWLETGIPRPAQQESADSSPLELSPAQRQLALKIIQAIRQNKDITVANRWKEIDDSIPVLGAGDIKNMSSAKTLTIQQLNQLVSLEHRLRNPQLPFTSSKPSWLDMKSMIGNIALDFPTIDNVTEMDPAKTRYQNGQWVIR